MKSRWLQWMLTGAVVVLLVPALLPLGRIYRLLDMANVPLNMVCGVEAHGGWYDLLKYTDGSEWAVLRVREDFAIPNGWSKEISTPEALPVTWHTNFLQALPPDARWTSWCYVPVDESLPFDDQAWAAAFYDAEANLLALYRGYALYGL